VRPEIEILSVDQRARVELTAVRTTIGNSGENDVVLAEDSTVSGLHAVLEHFAAGWCVTDLGSSNGTWLNGERLWAPHRVRHGDEIRVGRTRLIFRDWGASGRPATDVEEAAPSITARERDVLVALCRPLLARDMFTQPETTRAIAENLVVSDAAVKQHLANLYGKFGVSSDDPMRRTRLANEAIRRGSVTIADLSASGDA
jgi:predicted component of type VI protein secretion system